MVEVNEVVLRIPSRFHNDCTSKFVPIDFGLVLRSNWNVMNESVMFRSSFTELTQTSPSATRLKIVSPRKSIEWEETRRSTRFDYISAIRSRSDCKHGDYHLFIPVSQKKTSIRTGSLTFEGKTVRQSKTGVFTFSLSGGIQWAWLMLVFQIGHFTTEQRHQTTENKCLGE